MSETAAPRDFGQRPELTWLPVDRLDVDPAYQRSIDMVSSRRLIAKIAEDFRWAAFQAILATPAAKPECWRIIDGQHRVAAAKQIGLSLVPSVVIQGADVASQAIAFVLANRDRVTVSAQTVFHARVAAGDTDAVTVARLCKAAGIEILTVNQNQRMVPAGKTTATSALLQVLRGHGEKRAGEAIRAVAACYAGQQGGLRPPFFLAAALFLEAGGTPQALKEAFTRLGWRRLIEVNIAGGPIMMAREILVLLRRGASPEPERKQVPVASDPVAPFRAPAPSAGERAAASAGRFSDDPRARANHGSHEKIGRPEPFGRSPSGSSLV